MSQIESNELRRDFNSEISAGHNCVTLLQFFREATNNLISVESMHQLLHWSEVTQAAYFLYKNVLILISSYIHGTEMNSCSYII